jgi:hypothetical protein
MNAAKIALPFPRRYLYLLIGVLVVALTVGVYAATQSRPSGQKAAQPSHQATGPQATIRGKPAPASRLSLTGLPGDPRSTVIVVKVNNTSAGGRQSGINDADVVVEQLVEGGLTRLAVMYQSHLPPRVGPVRSGRSTDAGLVLPTRGWLVDSGASWFEQRDLDHQGVRTSHAYEYRTSGYAPYNLFLSPHLPPKGPALPAYFNFVRRPSGPSRPCTTATLRFGATTTTFTRAGQAWARSPDLASPPFRPDSVVIVRVRTRMFIDPTTGRPYHDAAMSPVPVQVLTGSGPATVLWHGRAYRGTWSKASNTAPWHLSTGVPVGRTALELVPVSGSVALR